MTSRSPHDRARRGASWFSGVRRRGRVLAVATAVALGATGAVVGQADQPAYAVDYPSWDDVLAARGDVAAKAQEIDRLRGLLAQLQQQVVEAQALEVQRGNEYQAAQLAYDEQDFKAQQLQAQADEKQAVADTSKLRAGQLAARLARTGGEDLSASLFFDGGSADDLLSQLGMASKISDQSAGLYDKARRDQNTAQSLTDQAEVARDALKELAEAAEVALQAAVEASEAARAAVAEQEANQVTLETQLQVLEQNRQATEADFQAGELYRAEQRRIAQEQAARAAAAAAAAGGGSPSGQVAGSGWTSPISGSVSSSYGYRIHPVYGTRIFHAGTDIGAGCGRTIVAAHAGRVSYAGWNGGYGNYIAIDHGGGVSTAYGHAQNGGLLVGIGAQVSAGQPIALVGTTGTSTGCHLHYEVRINGGTTNPIDFMRNQGAPL